jgi:hypothetical protein
MLQILLPHKFFPSDYMDDEDDMQDDMAAMEEGSTWTEAHWPIIDSNAEAGPSRLH